MRGPVLIFEKGVTDRRGVTLRTSAVDAKVSDRLPKAMARSNGLALPEVSELDVVRHYTRLSQKNFGIDTGFYPLGSCTMKYNPRATEAVAANPGFADAHPSQPIETLPGFMELLGNVQDWLADMTGMDAISLQPAAGAQGEFAGMLIFKRYFEDKGEMDRDVMIVPDNAHGTNPASAVLAGFRVHEVDCVHHGGLMALELLDEVIEKYGPQRIAGIMLTNPSTLGLFEENILAVAERLHEIGALLYYDGANLNALLGIVRPGDMGFDLVHINTHKTLSTPHGGGGPGSGPIGVKAHLADYLPTPIVKKSGDGHGFAVPPKSIGRMMANHGQFLVLVRAWAYILLHGPQGLREIGEYSIINANYLQTRLKESFSIPYANKHCMHEFVASAACFKDNGVIAKDIAKALLNDGFHAPTMYFPLIIEEALMIEPTESEGPEMLDSFAEAMERYAKLAEENPGELKALRNLMVKHLDETYAARNVNVKWDPAQAETGEAG